MKEEDTQLYEYDAFIACANNDRNLTQEIVQTLENYYVLKLCYHLRDFIPGIAVADNITNCIHKSKKTIVMLSKHFLESKWCMYEFHVARMESHCRNGKNIVIIVFLESIRHSDIPAMVLKELSSNSPITYRYDEKEHIFLMDLLHNSILK